MAVRIATTLAAALISASLLAQDNSVLILGDAVETDDSVWILTAEPFGLGDVPAIEPQRLHRVFGRHDNAFPFSPRMLRPRASVIELTDGVVETRGRRQDHPGRLMPAPSESGPVRSVESRRHRVPCAEVASDACAASWQQQPVCGDEADRTPCKGPGSLPERQDPVCTPAADSPAALQELPSDVAELLFRPADPLAEAAAHHEASCQAAEPPLRTKVEHLLEAARHLEGAGYDDEARLFRVEADAIRNASRRLLEEKRRELERLQREIVELEQLTGLHQSVMLQCLIAELTVPVNCDPGPNLGSLEEPGVRILTGRPVAGECETASRLLTGEELANALRALQNHPCASLKIIARPQILTMNGRAATVRSGGEFPVIVPAKGVEAAPQSQPDIEWINFGVTLHVVPFIVGDDTVRLSLEAEVTDRDFSNVTRMDGTVVPALYTRRIRTDVEAQFGETVAIACAGAGAGSHGERRSLLVLVTARRIDPPAHQAALP